MSEKQAKERTVQPEEREKPMAPPEERMVRPEELPVAGQGPQPEPEAEPTPPQAQPEGPKRITLDAYCRKVSSRVPPETLSVFFTRESNADDLTASFEDFEARLQEFMQAPLG